MSQKKLLDLVEALREAGQAEIGAPRYLDQHNAQVDAAARALVAEIETTVGHEWTCSCGHVNGSNLAICSQCARYPGETT